MYQYTVKYQAGTYEGNRIVFADDEEQAIAKVKSWVRKKMTIPMYYESYKVISSTESDH